MPTVTATIECPNCHTEVKSTVTFCPECGTHLFTRAPGWEVAVIIKLGTLDDLSLYGRADSANYICDAQPYHRLPDDMPKFQKWMHD